MSEFEVYDAVWYHVPDEAEPWEAYVIYASPKKRHYHLFWANGAGGVGKASGDDMTHRDAPGPVPETVRNAREDFRRGLL